MLWDWHLAPGVRGWIADRLSLGEEDAQRFVAFVAGVHDVGKAIPCFQDGEPSPAASSYIRHDTAGYLAVPSLLDDLARWDPVVESVPHVIGEVVGGHHGLFQPIVRAPREVRQPERHDPRLGGPLWRSRRQTLVDQLRALLDVPTLPDRFPRPVAAVVTGLVIVADWIASEIAWIKEVQWTAPTELAARWTHTVASARRRVSGLGLAPPRLLRLASTRMLVGQPANPLQKSIEDEFRPATAGLMVITASTGYGKTEAAVIAARALGEVTGRPGIAVCLPTQATTNAMWHRGVRYEQAMSLAAGPVTMMHSMSAFYLPYRDYCADDAALQWLNGVKRPLLAGLSVVTIDQVLIAALAVQHNMLRLWALTGKVLVIDEVHAYEPYMLALLGRVLSWCGYLRVSVVLMSATLPRHITGKLTAAYLTGARPERQPVVQTPDYPGWLFTAASGQHVRPSAAALDGMRSHASRRARIEHVRYEPGTRVETIEQYVRSAAEHGGCIGIVCATVESAQVTYHRVRAALAGIVPVTLLHARLPHRDRAVIEARIVSSLGKDATTENGKRPIVDVVISTALIEQSLDVDFDLVITDLAPIALLIQRLGRCWRHDRSQRPPWSRGATLVVLDPVVTPLPATWCAIYPEYELLATRRVLAEQGPWLEVPADIDGIVQRVHDTALPPIEGDAAVAWRARHALTSQHRALAEFAATPPPHLVDNLTRLTKPDVEDIEVSTRLGVDTARVIPQYRAEDGTLWLDPHRTIPFPRTRPSQDEIRALIHASVPCPQRWATNLDRPARRWSHPLLRDARIMRAPQHGDLRIDPVLGLVKGQPRDDL
ncbi:CRISPR-associated endonuclease/helicase Cas3 [Kibdelosporangium phytohabitans]|nr:CRISPR-associated endonuclease/helicase Cas3 [Kibdelosporangium phytohabitans]